MIQVCNEQYWERFEILKPDAAPCGTVFDDLYQLTFCPHKKFAEPKVPRQDQFREFSGGRESSRLSGRPRTQGRNNERRTGGQRLGDSEAGA